MQNRHRFTVAIHSDDMEKTFEALLDKARKAREHIPESLKLIEDEARLSSALSKSESNQALFEETLLEFEQSFCNFAFKVALQKLSELKSLIN